MAATGSTKQVAEVQDARTRLREAAIDRFGRQGVHGTSTRQIIADAGLKNPSAITYWFGSKANLFDDLIREVNREQSAIIQQQVALLSGDAKPSAAAWAGTAIDAANGLLSTERGCLLTRVWAQYDELHPDGVESFLAGDHPLARAWRDAVTATFPELPPMVAIARNVIVLRTLQWITVRRARRILDGTRQRWATEPTLTRPFLLELALNILTPPTAIADGELLE